MTPLFKIASIAAATVLLGSWSGPGANAQQSSACYQTCTIERNWPASQCASYCRGKAGEAASGRSRVYGYTRRQNDEGGYAGGCGTYRYWNGEVCLDARDK